MVLTREYLAQYIYLQGQIKRMRRRLEYYKTHPVMSEHGVVGGSMHDFPYAQCHFVISGACVKSDKERKSAISQLLVDLRGNEQLYEDMQMDIEHAIEQIPDLETKIIFQRRYIDNVSERQIGKELGFDRTTVCKRITKYLDSVKPESPNSEISLQLH